ncbi:Dos2-interacting transcription regulator of RNA-Pol-II-domain-containing protein [Xylariomycetidae sp. FL0641]|nr:Dos2-interacting transcription regulator of RNA-Pol-II-domain-containing protein [Xylariomycetidae sp. FL0641]
MADDTFKTKFQPLALQYVLLDENNNAKERDIAKQAATIIAENASDPKNTRLAIGEWVKSVDRWVTQGDDVEGNLIMRARALDFLATTLEVLREEDFSLKAAQIGLLVSYFASLFDSSHRAGIAASAKALRCLVDMKHFQPTKADTIIQNICKLGDDFKKQTPATRRQIYELIMKLLKDSTVADALNSQYAGMCGFMIPILDLCRNERDPENLMKWFEILTYFLQNFSPPEEVTTQAFKAFSAYFPIALRASATPSGITADDLKSAVRSCFAAHHRVAGHAIPFLVNKLDQGDAVTVAVKVDILQTLDACLLQYGRPEQNIVPYVDQIWGSLKYEVRNGEVADTIKATLKVITSLSKRLSEEDLRSFVASAWRDLSEDISNQAYTAQAGRLLVAIAGATIQSFSLITAQLLPLLQTTLKSTTSASHLQQLLALLNSVLRLRVHLVDGLNHSSSQNGQDDGADGCLKDELFGDSLFQQIYAPQWHKSLASQPPTEYVSVLKETIEGLAVLVAQKTSNTKSPGRLCSDATCKEVFSWLAKPVIRCPLQGTHLFEAQGDSIDTAITQEIRTVAAEALADAVPHYPSAFEDLLRAFLSSFHVAYKQNPTGQRPTGAPVARELINVSGTLCRIMESPSATATQLYVMQISTINAMLTGLRQSLSSKAEPLFCTSFLMALRQAIGSTIASAARDMEKSRFTDDFYWDFETNVERDDTPWIQWGQDDLTTGLLNRGLEESGQDDANVFRGRVAYCLWVVKQLYRRFTRVVDVDVKEDDAKEVADSISITVHVGIAKDFSDTQGAIWDDRILQHLASMATVVVRFLSKEEQSSLRLFQGAFNMFHDVAGRLTPVKTVFSDLDEHRTAMLSLGVIQAIYPEAIGCEEYCQALDDLCDIVGSPNSPCSPLAKGALDATLTALANRLPIKGNKEASEQRKKCIDMLMAYLNHFVIAKDGTMNKEDEGFAVQIFRSVMHFLAGDVRRFPVPGINPRLLDFVCSDKIFQHCLGRQFARYFELLFTEHDCLAPENHADVKKLSGSWLYHKAAQPYLPLCFPGLTTPDRLTAISRSVAIVGLLKQLGYERYGDDVEEVIRVCLSSLTYFVVGVEIISVLSVLHQVLDANPSALRNHLATLVPKLATVYEMAKNVAEIKERTNNGAPELDATASQAVECRSLALGFLSRLPVSFEAQYLLPLRQGSLRPLQVACGDPSRLIRRIALNARQGWERLA